MKIRTLPSLIALGCLLPLSLAAAQPDNRFGGSADREIGPPSKKTRPTAGGESAEGRMQETHGSHEYAPDTQSRSQAPLTSLQAGQVQRIPERELERRVTASSLIGKRVVDREGQDLGKVRDIGLTSLLPHLSPAQDSDGPTHAGPAEARIFIRATRALNTDGDLVAIPASQLQREGETLRLDMSQNELRSLMDTSRDPDRISMSRP